jgi:KDO2-lipid IV(A) lauroyltransferase
VEPAEAAAAQINACMEQLVREAPQQYLWGYARYKEPREAA